MVNPLDRSDLSIGKARMNLGWTGDSVTRRATAATASGA
jgi:hypothetical protein